MPDKEARPNCWFRLGLGGAESAAAFTKLEGLGAQTEVLKHWDTDAQGQPKVTSVAGRTTWNNVVLSRGVDENKAIYEWHKEVVEKGPAGARKECTIEQLDYTGTPIATYKLTDAWPCKYTQSSLDAGQNSAAVETIELAHDGCERI
jgi:phage tail-like protein